MGLRERKKARMHAAILEAAEELAHERGFEGLRVRDLTARLEISEATFFNYFPARTALLDAWLEEKLANAFADPAARARTGRAGIRRCIRDLARDAARADGLAAAAWREACHAVAIRGAAERGGLPSTLAAACDGGELRRDIEPVELAELLLGAVVLAIAVGSAGPDGGTEARALRAADLVLDGARRRHERVRLGRPASGTAPTPGA